jgi:hypothetical protein
LVILDDPEVAFKSFSLEKKKQARSQPNKCGDALYRRPKNNNSMIHLGRVRAYISEADIKRQKSARFLAADLRHDRIDVARQALLRNRRGIVLMLRQQVLNLKWQMLVELATH